MRIKRAALVAAVLAWIALCWTASFYAIDLSGWTPPPLIAHLSATAGGFLLFGLSMAIVGRFMHERNMELFKAIFDALSRIARGDFTVQVILPRPHDSGDEFSRLVQGINDMAADLGRMETMRQDFISNVSHEIQSPLTSIRGFARALQDEQLPQEQRRRYLAIIEEESERLSRLSDNMLRLASLDSEHHPFRPARLRLDAQLRTAALSLEPLWSAKEQELEVQAGALEIEADEDLLRQVWTNLIHNAVKFSPERERISISLVREGDEAVATVSNTGAPIPPESLPHLFERFYKVDKSRTREGGGSGLGLAISRKIVELHGGSIAAGSDEEGGTALTVRLPVRLPPRDGSSAPDGRPPA
ncbi:sensor histidine kinase [Paenibacillus pasadenensis]|uniref:histidine kinase n=2 Tax=Paenibacillus TaxID=44249 RepID=A0A2N5N4R8_9BACL|nr:sensor histidine kinase [Paenibacillus pasadenensis]QGG58678.1 two-component sensor histidine kinase [Paenibacillus sp. B01]